MTGFENFKPKRERTPEVAYEDRIKVGVGELTDEAYRDIDATAQKLSAQPVSWSAKADEMEEREQRNAGEATYVISRVDEANKISESYGPCTGIAAVGRSFSGKNISILSHQAPSFAVSEKFVQDMKEQLLRLSEQSTPGSVDVLIFGGTARISKKLFGGERLDDKKYREIMHALTAIVRETMHVEPRIFGAVPDSDVISGITSVILDTENRRLHMWRREGRAMSDSFDRPASEALE